MSTAELQGSKLVAESDSSSTQIKSKSLRTITVSINNRCPLRCQHCSVGFSTEFKGTDDRIGIEEMLDIIRAVDSNIYGKIIFAGGEPSLDPALLRAGIVGCKVMGLSTAIITAPVWAATRSNADRFLDSVPGLDHVILSYDRYHLEFLKVAHYETAVWAAIERDLIVTLHICYTEESEKTELLDRIAGIRQLVGIGLTRTVPVGNAAKANSNIKMEGVSIESVDDLSRIPRGCILGSVYVDKKHTAHGCCWSIYAPQSPFSWPKRPEGLASTLEYLENDARFRAVRARGFVDALTPNGQKALAQLLKGRTVANECHACLTAMREGHSEIWDEYIRE